MPRTTVRPGWRLGLLARIGLSLAIVGLVPLGLAALQLAGINRAAMVDQLLHTHAVAAKSAAEAVDGFLDAPRALAEALANDERLASDAASPEAQAAIREALSAWSATGIAGVALLDAAGEVTLQARLRSVADTGGRLLTSPSAVPVTIAEEGGARWAVLAAPRPGGGHVRVLADGEPLGRALDPVELGEQAQLLLLGRDGTPIVGSAADLAALPTAAREAALSAQLSGAGRYEAEGPARVAAWAVADEGRWIVVSTQPAHVAEAAANRMLRRTAISLALAALLVGALSLLAYRTLVRPVRALLAGQRRLAGLSSAPAAGSELEELRGALTSLERHAKDREALGEVFLGRYQVVEILGSGGMGTVFRGWDPRLQRTVALKTVHLEPSVGTTAGAPGLLAEAVAAAQVAHPNVVGIFDAEEVGEVAFVAMEFVDGIGLDRYLEERGRLDWTEVAPLGLAIARGLGAAHERNLVHRDVKPGNVLLGHDGSVKIADFGLAQFVTHRSERVGQVFGTPGFLAPEALLGQPYDPRCDLFALGVVLFRALAGRYPFAGVSFKEIVVATVRNPSPGVDALPAGAPPGLARAVVDLLAKDPEQRLGPATRVVETLEEVCREHGLEWRLDFTRSAASGPPQPLPPSANLPTIRLSAAGG